MQFKSRAGQSLLIIVLLIAVVFTIIASASYRLTTETQSARIQEDTVRTLAAADSGIEKGLQLLSDNEQGTFAFNNVDVGLTLSGIDAAASTLTIATASTNAFTSPVVQKDEQFTFYLYDYPNGTNYFSNSLNVFFGSQGGLNCNTRNTPSLEVTLIYGASASIQRWVAEPCPATAPFIESSSGTATITSGGTVDGQAYTRKITLNFSSYSQARLLVIRPLFADTRLGFQPVTGSISSQGRTITAEAVSTTGISKIVTLFRSNPQIPADFFVTTF